jgi:hypothetical protein
VVCSDAQSFETLYLDHLSNLPHVQTLTSQLAMKIVTRTPCCRSTDDDERQHLHRGQIGAPWGACTLG